MIVPDVTVNPPRAVTEPTAPVNVTAAPAAATFKVSAPSSVPLKTMLFPLFVIVDGAVKITGYRKASGLAPETVMAAPTKMEAALVNVMFVSGTLFPTLPEKATFPDVPACRVSVVAPLSVPEKLIVAPAAAPLVVLSVGAFVKETGPVIAMVPPLVVMFPSMLMATEPI